MSTEPIVAEAAGLCVNEHGGAIGMPQLCGEWIPNQVFWLLVTLVVMYFVLSKIALPRIAAVLADRKSTITNDLAAAEELKQKAVAAEKAYNDALANARTEAAKIVAQAKAEIQKDLDAATAEYARLLDVPFSFSSNGDGFVFRDATLATGVLEQNLALDEYLVEVGIDVPVPAEALKDLQRLR